MKLMEFLRNIGNHHEDEDGVNHGSAYEVVTPKGNINRRRRRETATDASRVGHGEAQHKPRNWKQTKRAKRKAQKKARRANRYV